MINELANKIVDKGIQHNTISVEEKEVYLYGYTLLIEISLCLISALIIAIVFNKVVELTVFIGCFMLLRTFGGGYHAKTAKTCILLSELMMILFCIMIDDPILVEESWFVLILGWCGVIIVPFLHVQVAVEDKRTQKRCDVMIRCVYGVLLLTATILVSQDMCQYANSILLSEIIWLLAVLMSLRKNCNT